MDRERIREIQRPIKEKYTKSPGSARFTLSAAAKVASESISCEIDSFLGKLPCGLHPGTGGDGSQACSAEMLLESLAGCAAVTLKAVATAMQITMHSAVVIAEGDVDFRGTLGIDKKAAVGFEKIRLKFELNIDADEHTANKLIELTERYCVVYQTFKQPPVIARQLIRVT